MNEELRDFSMSMLSPELRGALQSGDIAVVATTGISMNPYIYSHRGDRVVLKPVDTDTLEIYSVPLFVSSPGGKLILHRLIDKKDEVFIIQGDGELSTQYVNAEQIVAEAMGFYRKGKYIDCDAPSYKRYVRIWMKLRFIKPAWLFCRRAFRRIYRVVFRKTYWEKPAETK